MLQYSVDATNLVAGALAVVPSHNGLQHVAPVHRTFFVIGIGFR